MAVESDAEGSALDHGVFEYWAGNPSIEISHGLLRTVRNFEGTSTPDAAAGAKHEDKGASACMVLAWSVPCYMSGPEFCDFVGAFGEATHRRFRHCRVLHGRSPEEYLIAVWLASADAAAEFIEQYDGRQYNALEAGECRLRRIVGLAHSLVSAEEPLSPADKPRTSGPSHGLRSPGPGLQSDRSPPAVSRSPALGPLLLPEAAIEGEEERGPSCVEDLFMDSATSQGTENGFCSVCLEQIEPNPASYQLSELGGGVPLTILCGHTFHAKCLSRWCDATCPVCRFQQHPFRISCCDVCGLSEGLHICLVCGLMGCNSMEGNGHARQHFEATGHTYAKEVSSQRVWDYAGNGYVHRLLYNHEDGKMVEHTVPEIPASTVDEGMASARVENLSLLMMHQDADGGHLSSLARGSSDASVRGSSKKQESVVSEFNALLSSQMTAQRRYYEERQQEQETEFAQALTEHTIKREGLALATAAAQRHFDALAEQNRALEIEIATMASAEELVRRQTTALEALNSRVSAEQSRYEGKRADEREQQRAARQQRDREVQDLQQQIRDLELYLQMRKQCQASADASDLQGSHMVVMESEAQRGRSGRKGKRR